ncbi:MAG: YbbR-like domain-containing protein [Bacteroidales bacterium]|nr:YbbR-like domain-containing protein [Bacteroidales bacterium]
MPIQFRQRLRQSRAFFFALVVVVVVWIVASMSEHKNFREVYEVHYDGVDTSRFAVTHIDSTIMLSINSNGFHAFHRSINKNRVLHIDVSRFLHADTLGQVSIEINTADSLDVLRAQLDMRGVHQLAAVTPRLQLRLAQRQSKSFVPSIDNVQFLFDATAGLCGEPVLSPPVVTLYGSQASLDKIDHIEAIPQTISNIASSGKYTLTLDDNWRQYPDLRISTPTVDVALPVEHFIEKQLTLPVPLPDNNKHYRIYPNHITLSAMVPASQFAKVSPDDFILTLLPHPDSADVLSVNIMQFPATVRIKNVTPQTVQYIIIED